MAAKSVTKTDQPGTKRSRSELGQDSVECREEENDDPQITYNVPTRNAWEVLFEGAQSQKSTIYRAVTQKPKKPPPITVMEGGKSTLGSVRNILNKEKIVFQIKFTELGMRIMPPDIEAHSKILNVLKNNNIPHFTHPIEKPKRFVLYGLDRMEPSAVIKLLTEVGLSPISVKFMYLREPRYKDQVNYIVYFDNKDDINLQTLKNIRSINQVLVTWAHYQNKSTGISCCRNCLGWGHGATGCGLTSKCVVCGEQHRTSDCPLIKGKHEGGHTKIDQKHLKCGNCGGKHTATFKECPARLQYINNIAKRKPTTQRTSRLNKQPTPPIVNNQNFPVPVFANPMYSQQQQPNQNTYAEIAEQRNTQGDSSQLFTKDECKSIFSNFCQALQSCTTKIQQATVIADFAIKYFSNFP